MVKIKFLAPLREMTGQKNINIEFNGDVNGLIDILCKLYQNEFKNALFDKKGDLRDYVKIIRNGEDIGSNPKTDLKDEDSVVIFQTI